MPTEPQESYCPGVAALSAGISLFGIRMTYRFGLMLIFILFLWKISMKWGTLIWNEKIC